MLCYGLPDPDICLLAPTLITRREPACVMSGLTRSGHADHNREFDNRVRLPVFADPKAIQLIDATRRPCQYAISVLRWTRTPDGHRIRSGHTPNFVVNALATGRAAPVPRRKS